MAEHPKALRFAVRFALGLLLVLAVAEGIARVAEAIGPPALRWYDATTQLKIEQMEELDGVDVVFAGTSAAAQDIVPSVFTARDAEGRSAYNAALAGAVPVVTEPWLLDEVLPRLEPSLVVWGLTSLDFSPSWGSDNLGRYTDALAVRSGGLADLERAASRVSALVRYRSVLRRPSAIFGDEVSRALGKARRVLGDDGERRDFSFGRSERRGEIIVARLRGYDIDPTDVDAVVRTVTELRAAEIEVWLVELPVPNRMIERHPRGSVDAELAHAAIQAVGEVLDVPVLDLRDGFSDRDFVDYTHLDLGPARAFTTGLAAAMRDTDGVEETGTGSGQGRRAAVDTAARAIEINDTLYHYLLGGGEAAGRSEFWYGRIHHHYGRVRDLAVAQAEGHRFEILFVGSSMMVNAADPELFTELDGRTSFNAAMPRIGPEVIDLWLEEQAMPLADPDTVIYGVAPRDVRSLDTEAGSCADSTAEWDEAAGLRDEAFAAVDSLEGVDRYRLFFGDPPTAFPSRRVPVHQSYVAEYSRLGNRIVFDRTGDDDNGTVDILRSWAAEFELCRDRLDQIAATVRRLTDRGLTVVVVGMPIRDLRADAFGGGRAEVESILAEIGLAALDAGAAGFVDLSDLLPDDRFRDLAHTDLEGSRQFTRRLVEELARLGV